MLTPDAVHGYSLHAQPLVKRFSFHKPMKPSQTDLVPINLCETLNCPMYDLRTGCSYYLSVHDCHLWRDDEGLQKGNPDRQALTLFTVSPAIPALRQKHNTYFT